MPKLDALAEESTVFLRAYCAAPICTPSRGSFMTGCYPHVHGARLNNVPLHEHMKCLPEWIRAAGQQDFRSAYIGKWHLGDELYAQHGFDTWIGTEDGYQAHFSESRDPSRISPFQEHLNGKGYRADPKDPWIRDWSMKLPERDSKPAFIVDQAISFIEAGGGSPWLLSMNCLEPHHPLMGPCADAFRPDEVPDWPTRMYRDPDTLTSVKLRQEDQYRNGFEDFHLRDAQSWRQCCAHYWGQCRQVDNQYGRFLDWLREQNLYDDTLIVFCSDHGEMMGCHSLFGKSVPYEEASGIPLMIKQPGQREQRIVEDPVSNSDVLATLGDLLGIPMQTQGRSLRAHLEGTPTVAEDVLVVWDHPSAGKSSLPDWAAAYGDSELLERARQTSWRMLVTPEGWKYLVADTGERWAVNLREDPHERENVIHRLEPALHRELHERLAKKMKELEDPMLKPLKLDQPFSSSI